MAEREWVLLTPGPANTTETVRRALVMPDVGHREPECFMMMRRCRERLLRLAGVGADWTAVLVTGSGTTAVEAALCAAIPAGRSVLVVDNGVYGQRMVAMARAHGIPAEVLSGDIMTPVDPGDVDRALLAHPEVSHVALVHHETTTGLLNPLPAVARVATARGRQVVVDAVSSLFGERLDLAQPGLELVVASANKCLQGIPGVAFVLGRRAAFEALRDRAPRSVALDLSRHFQSQESDSTPFTPPVQVLHAMEQALIELEAEGVGRRIARYAENARVLREGLAGLGFEVLVPEAARSNILSTFRLPPGITYERLHDAMKARGYVIYAGQGNLGSYAFRVGNIGTLTAADMKAVVDAFAASLKELG